MSKFNTAESLFDDLINETAEKAIKMKYLQPKQQENFEKSSSKRSSKSPKKSKTTIVDVFDSDDDDDPLSDHVILNAKRLQTEKIMKKLKRCRVRLPKIGKKKLIEMIKKTIKKKKQTTPAMRKQQQQLTPAMKKQGNNNMISNDGNKSKDFQQLSFSSKSPTVRVARSSKIDAVSSLTRKRKSTETSPPSSSAKKSSPTKLFFKLDTIPKPISKSKRKSNIPIRITSSSTPKKSPAAAAAAANNNNRKQSPIKKKSISPIKERRQIHPIVFTRPVLEDTFGRQFFKCRVSIGKVKSLDNLNVTDLEREMEEREKKKLKKKRKSNGLNKSVSFMESVEILGEYESDEDDPDRNKNGNLDDLDDDSNRNELDNSAEGNNDSTKLISDGENITQGNNNSSSSLNDSSSIILTKEKVTGRIGRIRKSFSPLKSEEEQNSPRSKLLRKGDEKIVRRSSFPVDNKVYDHNDDEADDEEEEEDNSNEKNEADAADNEQQPDDDDDTQKSDHSELERQSDEHNDNEPEQQQETEKIMESEENIENNVVTTNNNDTINSTEQNENVVAETVKNIEPIYEPLSSDDSNDFLKGNEPIKSFLNKPIQSDDETEINYNIDQKPPASLNETVEKIIENGEDEVDNDSIFNKIVDQMDLITGNVNPSQSSEQFGEELKLSEDENDAAVNIEKLVTSTTSHELPLQHEQQPLASSITEPAAPPSTTNKFSFNSFLQSIKTKVMPGSSPKSSSASTTIETSTTTITKTTTTTYPSADRDKRLYNNDDDDDDDDDDYDDNNGIRPVIMDETDDESSALLGDPVLGGREMTY